jgi:hypothetical protein
MIGYIHYRWSSVKLFSLIIFTSWSRRWDKVFDWGLFGWHLSPSNYRWLLGPLRTVAHRERDCFVLERPLGDVLPKWPTLWRGYTWGQVPLNRLSFLWRNIAFSVITLILSWSLLFRHVFCSHCGSQRAFVVSFLLCCSCDWVLLVALRASNTLFVDALDDIFRVLKPFHHLRVMDVLWLLLLPFFWCLFSWLDIKGCVLYNDIHCAAQSVVFLLAFGVDVSDHVLAKFFWAAAEDDDRPIREASLDDFAHISRWLSELLLCLITCQMENVCMLCLIPLL